MQISIIFTSFFSPYSITETANDWHLYYPTGCSVSFSDSLRAYQYIQDIFHRKIVANIRVLPLAYFLLRGVNNSAI